MDSPLTKTTALFSVWFFQISITVECFFVELHELACLDVVDSIFAYSDFDGSLKTIDQVATAELHIVQNLRNRFPFDNCIEHHFAGGRNIHVDGVGISKEIVQVAKNFLIRSDQENPEVVRSSVEFMQHQSSTYVTTINELINLPVGVAGDIAQNRMPRWTLIS